MSCKPLLCVVSAVLPFPDASGQNRRVRMKLEALREVFELAFLCVARTSDKAATVRKLGELVDTPIVLESVYHRSSVSRLLHLVRGAAWRIPRGLKYSNYVIDQLELTPRRVIEGMNGIRPRVALFEYWHAWRAAAALRERGVETVLDLHDLLFESRRRDLANRRLLPGVLRDYLLRQYRSREERAWGAFDVLVTISEGEHERVKQVAAAGQEVVLAPMGVDTRHWSYQWNAASPPRVIYYGGLGGKHNQRNALMCLEEIMPLVWARHPSTEWWAVGSNPPGELVDRASTDPRVVVTGFLEDPRPVLASGTVLLCPWQGRYGFRSRLVEAMALGLPVVASDDAVAGMGLDPASHVVFEEPMEAAAAVIELLERPELQRALGMRGREVVEARFSCEATYGALAEALYRRVSEGGTV